MSYSSKGSAYKYTSKTEEKPKDYSLSFNNGNDKDVLVVLMYITFFALAFFLFRRVVKSLIGWSDGPAAYDWNFKPHCLKDSDRVFTHFDNVLSSRFWEVRMNTLWKHRPTGQFILSKTHEISHKQKIKLIANADAEKFIRDNASAEKYKEIIDSWMKDTSII